LTYLEEKVRQLERDVIRLEIKLSPRTKSEVSVYAESSSSSDEAPTQEVLAPLDTVRRLSEKDEKSPQPLTKRLRLSKSQPANARDDFLMRGIVSEQEARIFYSTFFSGCHLYVLAFDPSDDSFDSMRSRSPVCFDCLLVIGARSALGLASTTYKKLYDELFRTYSTYFLTSDDVSVEHTQALLAISCFSENAWRLIGNAVRLAKRARLFRTMHHGHESDLTTRQTTKAMRTWLAVYVMETA
jgi:hypothetical protein